MTTPMTDLDKLKQAYSDNDREAKRLLQLQLKEKGVDNVIATIRVNATHQIKRDLLSSIGRRVIDT